MQVKHQEKDWLQILTDLVIDWVVFLVKVRLKAVMSASMLLKMLALMDLMIYEHLVIYH